MKKILFIIITIFFINSNAIAQGPSVDDSVLDDTQASESYNLIANIQNIVTELKDGEIGKVSDSFVSITTLILCIGAICTITTRLINSMISGGFIDLKTLITPFIFSLIIGAYQPITKGVDWAVSAFDGLIVTISSNSLEEINIAREDKAEIILMIEAKIAAEEDTPWYDEGAEAVKSYLNEAKTFLTYHSITLLAFCATFLTKLTGAVLSMIFYIIGPIAIALSAIPAFADNWKNWLAKYIWVLLFTPICRIIAWVLQEVELIILRNDVSRLTYCLDNFETTKGGLSISGGSFMEGTTYIGFMIVGAMLYLSVPSIASWVVNTSGGGVMTGVNAMGAAIAGKASKAGKEAVAEGASIGGKASNVIKGLFNK